MNICVCVFGKRYNKKCFQHWIDQYHCDIPAILIYNSTTSPEAVDMWPFNKHKLNTELIVKSNQKEFYWTEKSQLMYCSDIMKFVCYKEIGDCLVMDYDAIIKKNITLDMIPECNLGAALFSKYSNFFNASRVPCTLTFFDEYDYVPWVNSGVILIKEDHMKLLMHLIKKYLNQLRYHVYVESYLQSIVGLLHRCANGVYLAPEWNWHPMTKIENNSVIIEHYYGSEYKEVMGDFLCHSK